MKIIHFFSVLLLWLLFAGCHQYICCDSPPELYNTGKIYGYDMTLCACCGDVVIDIDGDNYDQNHFRFVSLPANSGIDLQTTTYPIPVKFKWHLDESHGCKQTHPRIIIDAIEVLN